MKRWLVRSDSLHKTAVMPSLRYFSTKFQSEQGFFNLFCAGG